MKYALMLLVLSVPALASPYKGVLDLGTMDPQAIALRDLENGIWRVGSEQQIWHLQNTQSNVEVFHVSGYWATRLEGQEPAYGPSVGFNVSEAMRAALGKLEILAPVVANLENYTLPPFVAKLTAWTSLEVYVGYSPNVGGGDHHLMYGVGGRVTIPVAELYQWASGTQSQGTGVKGL